jgi:hypothetical protein
MDTSDIYEKATAVAKAWNSLRPTKTFFRMSLEDFRKIIAASGDARSEIVDLESRTQGALARRDEADRITRRAVVRVVNGVRGDADEGEDSELLAAMGYIPHTARVSIIAKGRKQGARAAQQASAAKEEET